MRGIEAGICQVLRLRKREPGDGGTCTELIPGSSGRKTRESFTPLIRTNEVKMLAWIRNTFGTTGIIGTTGLIAIVFIFYGVFTPKSTRGLHEGAVAGTVNGDAISLREFNYEYNRMMEMYKGFLGGKITDEQVKSLKLKESALEGLVKQKVLLQEAVRYDLSASDDEVMEEIKKMSVFHKDGKFDVLTYKKLLEANHLSPGGFEKSKRDELAQRRWSDFFRARIHVSDQEIIEEFKLKQNKRSFKYVLLTSNLAKQNAQVQSEEIQKYLEDPAHLTQVKARFEEGKNTAFKGQTFDSVKNSIVQSVILGEKLSQAFKVNDQLAEQVVSLMRADAASDSQINSLLKSQNVQVKKTGLIALDSDAIPEVGSAKEAIKDALSDPSPIDAAQGGKAKKYLMGDRVLIALVIDSQKPDLTQLESQRAQLAQQVFMRKIRSMYQLWESSLVQRAKIDLNPAVVGSAD